MPAATDMFEERLKRLNTPGVAQRAEPILAGAQLVARMAKQRTQDPQTGSLVMGMIAMCVLVIGAGAFSVMLLAPEIVFSTALPLETAGLGNAYN